MSRAKWDQFFYVKAEHLAALSVGDYVMISRKWFEVTRVITHGRERYVHIKMARGYSLDLNSDMLKQMCTGIKRRLGV